MARWRQSFYKLVPSWLSTGDGEKVLFSLGVLTDIFIDKARAALTARFPTYSAPTGLRMLGDERGIPRGRRESNEGFARRLREWRGPRGHLVRGNSFAMLRQVWNYFGGIKCEVRDNGGNVYTIERDGTESVTHGNAWDWDAPPPEVHTPEHDPDSLGSDIGDALIGTGSTGELILACDGTPGRLIFLHLNRGRVNSTAVPRGRGWELVAEHTTEAGTGHPYVNSVWQKIVGPYESFEQVFVDCANNEVSGGAERFIGRCVNVPGEYDADCVVAVDTAASNGTSVAVPETDQYFYPSLKIAFIGGRLTTYSAATDGGDQVWTEIGAERTAGATGIAVDEQYLKREEVANASNPATITLGATSAASVIVLTVVSKLQKEWYRFWLRILPEPDQGIASRGTWSQVAASLPNGKWGDGAGQTLGQTGVAPGDADTVSNLFRGPRPWKLAGTKPEYAIIVLGNEEEQPNGRWGNWTYQGEPSPRESAWRFWKL